jgi:hypothetical protein
MGKKLKRIGAVIVMTLIGLLMAGVVVGFGYISAESWGMVSHGSR